MGLPRFLAELKHRKVYRVALVYAGVGWALLEASGMVLPRLDLPDWTVNFVLAMVLLGFPLALIFAWIFDFSPTGIVRTEPLSPASHHHSLTIAATVEFALILALVVAVGSLYVERLSLQKSLEEARSALQENPSKEHPVIPNPEQYRALAVLPFADMSEAGDQAWFAEGIAEELLIALSQIDELNVMARTSSFAFKDTDKTVAEIADILGVQAVLEGSVRRSEDRVRITAQLVDARSGFHIWSGSYERRITDIFHLQDELAKAVVQALRVELGVDSAEPLVAEQTRSPEAYNWFIRGRAVFDWANRNNVEHAIRFFENAVEHDPSFAKAWGSLALARALSTIWKSTDEMAPATREAYERSLILNPKQSEALAAKAWMLLIIEYDWETVGRLYQQSLAETDNLNAKTTYGIFYLTHIDQTHLAISLCAEAEQLDPVHAGLKSNLANLLIWSGEPEKAMIKAREALQLKPHHVFAVMALIEAYTQLGQFSAGEELLDGLPLEILQIPSVEVRAGLFYLARGEQEKAEQIYRYYLENLENSGTLGIMMVAKLALELGDYEGAIDLMEGEVRRRSWTQFWARTLFRNHPAIKDHPRYLALLRQIRLDDESVNELQKKLFL